MINVSLTDIFQLATWKGFENENDINLDVNQTVNTRLFQHHVTFRNGCIQITAVTSHSSSSSSSSFFIIISEYLINKKKRNKTNLF